LLLQRFKSSDDLESGHIKELDGKINHAEKVMSTVSEESEKFQRVLSESLSIPVEFRKSLFMDSVSFQFSSDIEYFNQELLSAFESILLTGETSEKSSSDLFTALAKSQSSNLQFLMLVSSSMRYRMKAYRTFLEAASSEETVKSKNFFEEFQAGQVNLAKRVMSEPRILESASRVNLVSSILDKVIHSLGSLLISHSSHSKAEDDSSEVQELIERTFWIASQYKYLNIWDFPSATSHLCRKEFVKLSAVASFEDSPPYTNELISEKIYEAAVTSHQQVLKFLFNFLEAMDSLNSSNSQTVEENSGTDAKDWRRIAQLLKSHDPSIVVYLEALRSLPRYIKE
jgi:hypothetical protein